MRPDVFWYTSGATLELPFDITGLVAFELIVMHWVESRRGYDIKKPGSMDQDPIFSNFKLPSHEVGAWATFDLWPPHSSCLTFCHLVCS